MLGPPPPRGYSFSQTPAGRRLREAAHQQRVDHDGAFAAAFSHIALADAIPPPPQAEPSPQQAIPPPEQAPTEQAPLPPPKQAPPPPEQAPLPLPQQVEHCCRFHRPSLSHRRARRPFSLSPVLLYHTLPLTPKQAHHHPPPNQAQPPQPEQHEPPPKQAQPPPLEQAHQPLPKVAQPLPPEQAQPPPPKQAHQAHPEQAQPLQP